MGSNTDQAGEGFIADFAQLGNMREDWKKQNDRLISALDKIDPQ